MGKNSQSQATMVAFRAELCLDLTLTKKLDKLVQFALYLKHWAEIDGLSGSVKAE